MGGELSKLLAEQFLAPVASNTNQKYRPPSKSDTGKIPIQKKLLVTLQYTTLENRLFLRACFPTACSPTAPYFGWCLGGVTFNLKMSGQFLHAVPKMCAVGQKNVTDRMQKLNFACGW
jgi:hypothetical protein